MSGPRKQSMVARTVDDVCNQPPGSFEAFVREQQRVEREREMERIQRIRGRNNHKQQ